MIVNRRKRRPEPLLLDPAWVLDGGMYTWRQITTLTGELFEALSGNIFRGATRGTTNGTMGHCPDLLDERERLAVESKGSNKRSQFKICPFQVERYMQMRREGWRAVYCLWTYGAMGLRKQYETVGRIAEAVVGSVLYCDILDASIVQAVCETVQHDDLAGARWLKSWKKSEIGTRAECPLVLLTQTFLRRLRAEPDKVLFAELGLDRQQFMYSAQGHLSAAATHRNRTFRTGSFVVWQITERDDWIPF